MAKRVRAACAVAGDENEPLGLKDAGALAVAGTEELLSRAADEVVARGKQLARKVTGTAKRKRP